MDPAAFPASNVVDGLHSAGLLFLEVTNLGAFGSPFTERLNAGWRGAEYLYLSGLWVGAIGSDQQPHVTTGGFSEFRPDPDPRWRIYESYEGILHGTRFSAQGLSAADDDGDGLVDEDFQNGLDDDGDGRIDEDFAAIGQQMLSTMYRDDTPEAAAVPDHTPLGLLVRQRSFQWSSEGNNEFVGVDFQIVNVGDQALFQLFLGIYTDADVGDPGIVDYYTDDRLAFATIDTSAGSGTLPCDVRDYSLSAAYMWDGPHSVPGVFGNVLLGHTTDLAGVRAPQQVGPASMQWWGTNIPTTDASRYLEMGAGVQEDPVSSGDYRYLMSVGPFSELNPGESLNFQIGYVVGDGESGFRTNAVNAARVFSGAYFDADQNPNTGINGKETCLQVLEPGTMIVWDDPCDTSQTTIVFKQTDPCNVAGPHHVDADCDPCTGVDGKETHVTWLGSVAPPFPATNLDPSLNPLLVTPPAGDGQVTLEWDNLPERFADPITGQILFAGYRIWRVDDWHGTYDPPLLQQWHTIGEYWVDPEKAPQWAGLLWQIRNTSVDPIGQDPNGRDIYPIGRYTVVDSTYVVNGKTYLYCITAFALVPYLDPGSGLMEEMEIERLPYSPLEFAVVPADTSVVPVRLLSFSALRVGPGAELRWTVGEAQDHAGFHVYRAEPGTQRVRLTETLLTGGPEYAFLDPTAPQDAVDYWLQDVSRTGEIAWHGPVHVEASSLRPGRLLVGLVNPNPFRERMALSYTLPDTRTVHATVYDLAGRRVRELENSTRSPGTYTLTWNGETEAGGRVAPGLYLLRFDAGSEVVSRKVLFVP